MVSAGAAVFERELTQARLTGAFLVRYSAFVAWAVSHVLNTKTVELLDTILVSQYQEMVVLPTVDAATPAGYRTDQALEYFQNEYLLDDIATVIKAIKAYADAKNLTKRAARNLLRDSLKPDARVLERIPDELLALSGKGAPKLKHKGFPFAEVGMTYEDRIKAQARTIATGMNGFVARREAERNDEDLRWVTMRDDRVRVAHVHAQGQTVPADEPFYVGGYPMWFPGDPSAPEDLTVNCRCVLATVPKPERRWVQRYVPAEWLNAAGGLPATTSGQGPEQARAPKGSPGGIGGQWIDTPTAMLRSLNRLESGSDLGENMRPVDEMKAERRRLAAEVLEREGRPSLEETADRITAAYEDTPLIGRKVGDQWYDEGMALRDEMVADPRTDLTKEQAAAIIAHLSTQTRWEGNADYARSMAAGLTQDEAMAHLKAEIAAGRIVKGKRPDYIMDRNWQKALDASTSDDPIGRGNHNLGTFSEANKTRTFASNLMGDEDGVTVDIWMQRVLGQQIKPTGSIKDAAGNIINQKIREDQIYEALAEAIRVAADRAGLSPVDMQAITWGWALDHEGRIEESLALAAAADPNPQTIADEPMPDYYYAQAESLMRQERKEAPEKVTLLDEPVRGGLPAIGGAVRDALTAGLELSPPGASLNGYPALAPGQARAPRGTPIGGEWIETPSGLARGLDEGTLWPEEGDDTGVYITPAFSAPERTAEETAAMLNAGMGIPDQDRVIGYTGGAYALANETLRGPGTNDTLPGMVDDNTLPRDQWTKNGQTATDIIGDLDSQVGALPEDVVLYRNLNKQAAFGTDDPSTLAGMVIQDKGYMSTSFDGDRYRPLNEVGHPAAIMRIRAPKGTRAINAAPVSAFPDEAEVILDRGTRIAIIGYDPFTGIVDAIVVADPVVTASLTAALSTTPKQARAPKGASGGIGGEWIPTPLTILAPLKVYGADKTGQLPVTGDAVYEVAQGTPGPAPEGWELTSEMHPSELTMSEREALTNYTGYVANNLNNALRYPDNFPMSKGLDDTRVVLDSALTRQALPDAMMLYRDVPASLFPYGNDAAMEGLVGKVMADKSYLSTTTDPERVGDVGKIVLDISAPKGMPAVWAKPLSEHPEESEMLLGRDLPLAITGVYNDYGTWHIQASVARPAGAPDFPAPVPKPDLVDPSQPTISYNPYALTAAASIRQARAPKGTIIGGQWIDTPSAILHMLGWHGEEPEAPSRTYDIPVVNPEVVIPMRTADPMERKKMIDDEAARLAATQPVIPDIEDDIRFYTATGALNLNTNLRAGSRDPGDEERIAHLDAAIASGVAPYDMYVYRAMPRKVLPHPSNPFSDEGNPEDLIGTVLADRAYLSTSIDSRGAGASSDTIMRIAIPKGHPILWAEPHSHNPGEYEVMLGRDTPLAITSIGSDPWGDPVYEAVIAYPSDLAAALTADAPPQARAPKGTDIGGQWIDTPEGLLNSLGVNHGTGHGPDAALMAERLGAPGDPVTLTAMQKDPKGYQNRINPRHAEDPANCQRCVYATELQARGFAASAAYATGNESDVYMADITERLDLSGTFDPGYGETRQWTLPERNMTQAVNAGRIPSDPPGSRYFLQVKNKRTGGGHILNAEKDATGKMVIFDGQSGNTKFRTSEYTDLQFIRVDDLPLDSVIFDAVNGNPAWVVPEGQAP